MRILATADLHGELPEIPECDLLLIGGDVCPIEDHTPDFQLHWLDIFFRAWLKSIPAKHIIGIAGNHDFIFEKRPADVQSLFLPWEYLKDDLTHYDSISIYGTPWVPNLPSWAFHQNKEQLAETYNRIPGGTDIVLSHGPPYGYGDKLIESHLKASEGYNPHCGSKSASNMLERVKPGAYVTGHIHEAFGHYPFMYRDLRTDTDIYNVSYVDEDYVPRGQIIEIMLDDAIQNENHSQREIRSENSDPRYSPELTA